MTRTEGHRLLREVVRKLGRGAQAAIARRIGRSEPAVSLVLRHGSRPDGDGRTALEREFGIPVPAWTQKARRKA
jgi:hypothetical protein